MYKTRQEARIEQDVNLWLDGTSTSLLVESSHWTHRNGYVKGKVTSRTDLKVSIIGPATLIEQFRSEDYPNVDVMLEAIHHYIVQHKAEL